jgi:hypothetical protein
MVPGFGSGDELGCGAIAIDAAFGGTFTSRPAATMLVTETRQN